jgi:hypothetical protein
MKPMTPMKPGINGKRFVTPAYLRFALVLVSFDMGSGAGA